jgi:hypothetical protein
MSKTMSSELNAIQQSSISLEKDIDTLMKERDELGIAPHKLSTNRIQLDVGGTLFSTTMDTLTSVPDSMLGRMFSGRFPLRVNEDDGRIFIDRDGTHFHLILNFLRDPENNVVRIDKSLLEEFKVECHYYGLMDAMFKKDDFLVPDKLDWLDNKTIRIQSFSSQLGGHPCTNILDPNMTYWLSESPHVTDQWMVYEFPKKVYVNKIMMKVDNYECSVKDWNVQVSDDDDLSNWNTVKEFQARCGNQTTSDQFFEDFEVRAKYIKLFFKNNWGLGGGSYILITNIKFFGGEIED